MTAKQFLAALIVLTCLPGLNDSARAIDSFEDASPPSNWTVSGGGTISIASSVHFKDGYRALEWDWQNGSYLVVDSPANLGTAGTNGTGGIIFWVYNETAIDDHLTFYFGDQSEILAGTCRYKFEFGLNYEGWRAGWVKFSEDAVNPSWTYDASMDWMYIESPASGSGTLYLDMVDFIDSVVYSRSRDYQLPYINPNNQELWHHWQHTYKWSQHAPLDSPPATVTQAQKDDFNIIKQRYDDFLLGTGGTPASTTGIEEEFGTSADRLIEIVGSGNETTQTSESSGYRWGAYHAGGSLNNIHFDNEPDDRMRFRPGANVNGSYIYTVFDPTGSQPPAGTDTVEPESITFAGSARGLYGTYVRLMVRKAADSTWYLSDPVAAAEYVSVNVSDLQWTALTSAGNTNLNLLADGDEAAVSTTGSPGSFSSMVGGAIDGGGFYIETGTVDYFAIDKVTWGTDGGSVDLVSMRYSSLQSFISGGVSQYSSFNIFSNGGDHIAGIPLFCRNSAYTPEFGEGFGEPVLLPLALDYRLNGVSSSKDKFLEGLDYLHDQGWAEGSSMGNLDHQANMCGGLMCAMFLMRDEMSPTQKDYVWRAMDWHSEFGEAYKRPFEFKGTTADRFQCTEIPRLFRILMMDPNDPNWVRDMNNFDEWFDNACSPSTGWAGTIRADYTGLHHLGIQADTYAPAAFHAAAAVIYMLHGTDFAVTENALDNVTNALLEYRKYLNKYDMNPGIGGRSATTGENAMADIIPAYAYMALASGDANTSQMTGIFKRLLDTSHSAVLGELSSVSTQSGKMWLRTLGASELMEQAAAAMPAAETTPTGNWSYNWSALMAHRRGEWLASVKGWSKYVLNFESPGTNELGWNQSSGGLQIYTAEGRIANGVCLNNCGWEWNRYPGTTAAFRAHSALVATEHRLFTKKGFVGSVSLEEQNGLFAIDLWDNLYGMNLKAKKTYFFFDDVIVCLGSDITDTSASGNVETTLFQGKLDSTSDAIYDNSLSPISAFPYSNDYTGSGSIWLMDAFDNGYYIPDKDGVKVRKQSQTTTQKEGSGTSSGNYATAWFSHGTNPASADYEYAVLVQSIPANVAGFASSPTYQVLQKDADAHIVEDTDSDTIGYAMFASDSSIGYGHLKSVDAPCLVMIRQASSSNLKLTLADPDIHINDGGNPSQDTSGVKATNIFYNNPSQESTVTITLDGKWEIAAGDPDATVISSSLVETTIEFVCKDGKSINLDLISSMNFMEYADFTRQWMDTDCGDCYGADLTGDGDVNMPDLDEFTDRWLITE